VTPPAGRIRVVYCEGNVDRTVGGSYYSLLYLVQGLDPKRYAPEVVLHRDNPFAERFRAAGAAVTVFPPRGIIQFPFLHDATGQPRRALAPLGRAQSVLNLGTLALRALNRARFLRGRADLLHLNNSITRLHDWILGASLAGVPVVVHERGIHTRLPSITRQVAPRVAAILCISDAVRANLRALGIGGPTVALVHNGLDPARVVPRRTPEEVRRELQITAGAPIIGVIGNLKRWKGQDVLVRAMPAILRERPDTVALIVGTSTDAGTGYVEELHALTRSLGVASQVRFTGFTDDAAGLLGAMDVAIHTSVEPEPFGRVLLEGMALRKPVVGSGSGAVPEIVVDGVTGFTFEPGNAEALADRVSQLLRDPARARAMGEAGLERLRSHFTLDRNVERTTAIYDAVLRGHPLPGIAGDPRPLEGVRS
jgi:L-malate glycosyltransferase